jgi:hypothetical protein
MERSVKESIHAFVSERRMVVRVGQFADIDKTIPSRG